jgi:hypothetical protein
MQWWSNEVLDLNICTEADLGGGGSVLVGGESAGAPAGNNAGANTADGNVAGANTPGAISSPDNNISSTDNTVSSTNIPFCSPQNGATTSGQAWSNIGLLFILFWFISFCFHVYYVKNMQWLRELFLLRADFLTCETVRDIT